MMKKRVLACVMVGALAASMATTAYASVSSAGGANSGGGSGSVAGRPYGYNESAGGVGSSTGASASGASVTFADNTAAATAGLPSQTVDQINGINSGANLAQTITNVEGNQSLDGYNALGTTHAAIVTDGNGAAASAVSNVTLYVPNLTADLGAVQVLFYNNETGRWEVLTPHAVDVANKTVSVSIPNSGTLSVVYKK